jgi:AI-2E family transporter
VLQGCTIGLFTFYLVADGPRLRRAVCSVLRPERHQLALRIWELAIESTGGYVYSRALLAGVSATATWLALTLIGVPYPLALPAAATVRSLVSIYAHRYEVVASPLTTEQSPRKGEAASPSAAADSPAGEGLASTREELST